MFYRTARGRLEPSAGDLDFLEGHVKKLARRGAYYALFLQPSDPNGTASALGLSKQALRDLALLRGWGAGTTYPLLLHIYAEVDAGRATHDQAESCLEAIESFIVRRYIVDVPTNVLNRLFTAAIGKLPAGSPSIPRFVASCRATNAGLTMTGSVMASQRSTTTRIDGRTSSGLSYNGWNRTYERRWTSTSTPRRCRSNTSCHRR